jgi:hypothetical protein
MELARERWFNGSRFNGSRFNGSGFDSELRVQGSATIAVDTPVVD